jgi:hypothetical protein
MTPAEATELAVAGAEMHLCLCARLGRAYQFVSALRPRATLPAFGTLDEGRRQIEAFAAQEPLARSQFLLGVGLPLGK